MAYRPPFIKQLDGSTYGGVNCTVAATCMAIIRHLKGKNPAGSAKWYPTPRYVRSMMGDHYSGTTLSQNEAIAWRLYRADLDVHYRLSWGTFVKWIKIGRGAVLQGRYAAFKGTKFDASRGFFGNHAVYINETRINSAGKREFLMYDPLADGRQSYYHGPIWISEARLKKFAGLLQMLPSHRDLGIGLCYAMFTRDTEPATPPPPATSPYQPYVKIMYAKVNGSRIRRKPTTASTIVRKLSINQKFSVRLRTQKGQLVSGSRTWYGNATGTEWMHSSVLKLTT